MEYRIEQLARSAGVAVDTIRFYQGKGLLDAPRREGRVTWYGEGHLGRLRRIKELQQQGFTLTVIQRFLTGELDHRQSESLLLQQGFTLTVIQRFLTGELEASDEALVAA